MPYSAVHEEMTADIAAEIWPDNALLRRLFLRMMRQESAGFDLDVIECRRDSRSGARGIAQLMPVHWAQVDPCDPPAALRYGARYLIQSIAHTGSVRAGVAGYNAGPAAVRALIVAFGSEWERHLDGLNTAANPGKADEVRAYLRIAYAGEEEASMPVVTPPPVTWTPAHPNNFTAGRLANVKWEGLVFHTTGGGSTIEALDSWFQNPDQRTQEGRRVRVSTPFGIGRDRTGAVVLRQYVNLADTAHAHGIIQNPTAQIVLDNGDLDPNTYLIGCELVDGGVPGNHDAEMIEMAARWAAWMCETQLLPHAAQTGFTVSRERILGHYQIDGVDRAQCPSWPQRRYDDVIARVSALLEPAQPADLREDAIRQLRDGATLVAQNLELRAQALEAEAKLLREDAAGLRAMVERWARQGGNTRTLPPAITVRRGGSRRRSRVP
jgi:hypothetical protein